MFKFIRPEFFDIFGIGTFFIHNFYIYLVFKNLIANSKMGIDCFVDYWHTWIFSGYNNSLSDLH